MTTDGLPPNENVASDDSSSPPRESRTVEMGTSFVDKEMARSHKKVEPPEDDTRNWKALLKHDKSLDIDLTDFMHTGDFDVNGPAASNASIHVDSGNELPSDSSPPESLTSKANEPLADVANPGADDIIDLTTLDDEDLAAPSSSSGRSQPVKVVKQEPLDADLDHATIHNIASSMLSKTHNDNLVPSNVDDSDSLALLAEFNRNHSLAPIAHPTQRFDQPPRRLSPIRAIDSDEEERESRAAFNKHKASYQDLVAQGENTYRDDIEFQRAETYQEARQRWRQQRDDRRLDDAIVNDDLFIPEQRFSLEPEEPTVDLPAYQEIGITTGNEIIEIDSDGEQPSGKKKGRRGGRKSRGTAPRHSGRISKTASASGTATGGARHKQQRQRKVGSGVDDLAFRSLFHQDIPAAAHANRGLGPQPNLGPGKNKQDALKALIASLPADQQDLYRGDKVNLHKASMGFTGRGAMKADGHGKWRLKGMRTSLEHFQMLGASWMRTRENDKNPRGGILADTMGFGKTLMTIANIVDGRPVTRVTSSKATLIVVPPALLSQWLKEFKTHVEPEAQGEIMVYRAGSKVLTTDTVATLSNANVVITSYHEVLRSMPRNNPPIELVTAEAKLQWWTRYFEQMRGDLHKVSWYRIVLDEAQAIKNHKALTSIAVRALPGRFRWCLSGTPIQNALEEFYPFFAFLRCENAGESFELFRKNYCKRGSEKAMQRLQVVLGKIMLRRTHEHTLFGRPILKLPDIKPVQTIEVKFNPVERAVYNIVRNRFLAKIKSFAATGGMDRNYSQIFVMLLRLRQLVGHPLLIQKTLRDIMEREDLERLWNLTRAELTPDVTADDDGSIATVQGLDMALTHVRAQREVPGSGAPVLDNELSKSFRQILERLQANGDWAEANARSVCHLCGSSPADPHLTPCLHLYCLACINALWAQGLSPATDQGTCVECGTTFRKSDSYPARAFEETTGTGQARSTTTVNNRANDDESLDWFTMKPMLRSAKVKGAVQQIREWFLPPNTNKIIVFVQFRGMIRVLERVCREEGWGFATFDGSMSFEARDLAIETFRDDPDIKILIAALKAGGTGLNLTAANRVIIIDLWWNNCVEAQAFCRCYRIGQTRPVEVVRFTVADSIDTEILNLQNRKAAEIAKAMEDRHRPQQLSIDDLVKLFGSGVLRETRQAAAQACAEDANDSNDGDGTRLDTAHSSDGEESFTFANDPCADRMDEITAQAAIAVPDD